MYISAGEWNYVSRQQQSGRLRGPSGASRGVYSLLFCFFFQAEDGIRDIGVTGVQTCALPISGAHQDRGEEDDVEAVAQERVVDVPGAVEFPQTVVRHGGIARREERPQLVRRQIGRASCRERV